MTTIKKEFTVNGKFYKKITQPIVGICLDGTSVDYIEAAIKGGYSPIMKKLKEQQFYKTAVSVMPSYTNPNNIAIVTGVEPSVNGICGNYFYDVDQKCEVMMNEPEFLRVPTILEAASKSGYKVAAVTAKNKLLKLLSKGWEGTSFSGEFAHQATLDEIGNIAEHLGETPPHYSESHFNRYTMQAAYLVFCHSKPDLMYISLTDGVQHRAAPGEMEANRMLSEIDKIIGQFISKGARIGITADHGMNFKTKEDGSPNVIYIEEFIADFSKNEFRVVLPITDPYVSHHAALGSFATIYCTPEETESFFKKLEVTAGIAEVLRRNEAAKKYSLPRDRIGDLVIIAEQTCHN